MDPRDLENRFLKVLEDDGFLTQKALFSIKHLPDGRIISNRSDFFGVWDIIALRGDSVYVFQICSGTTYEEHRRKIEAKFPFTINPEQYIVYYFKEKGRWAFTLHKRTEVGWIIMPFDEI